MKQESNKYVRYETIMLQMHEAIRNDLREQHKEQISIADRLSNEMIDLKHIIQRVKFSKTFEFAKLLARKLLQNE